MAVDLKVTLGTINYTDFVHVTAAKVSDPSTIVWEDWIDVPVANYVFIIPGLDPEDYYITYYDAPTNVALGTLVAQILANALTSEFTWERRFYTCMAEIPGNPAVGDTGITDPYLIGKNVTGCFKESFRYLEEGLEYNFNPLTGYVNVINGTTFSENEKFTVEIKYATGITPGSANGGLYKGTLTVTDATKTLLASDRNKRVRCMGTASTQVLTLPLVAALAQDEGYYFDNTCGGVAMQVKLLLQGANKIKFNGFASPSDDFVDFWVSKGEHLLLRKFDGTYYEVISEYKGTNVGERFAAGFLSHPSTIPEDGGTVYDGDELGRVWWWLTTQLPVTHTIIDDSVIDPGYVHPDGKQGLFVLHSSLKKFRTPNTQNLSERGMKDYDAPGSDDQRIYDYPGGKQNEMAPPHDHGIPAWIDNPGLGFRKKVLVVPRNVEDFSSSKAGTTDIHATDLGDGSENRVKNIAVVYLRRI